MKIIGAAVFVFLFSGFSSHSNADNVLDVGLEQECDPRFSITCVALTYLTVVARTSVSITDIVLNEGNCEVRFNPWDENELPVTFGMGDDLRWQIDCKNLIKVEFKTTRGDLAYEFR